MYATFQKSECAKARWMAADYDKRQETMLYNRIDAMPTYMRCFKDTVQEQKMRTDAYRTRFYGQWDCGFTEERNVQLDAMCGLPLEPQMMTSIFPEQTRQRCEKQQVVAVSTSQDPYDPSNGLCANTYASAN